MHHIVGLADEEIRNSYALLSKRIFEDTDEDSSERELARILDAAKALRHDVYKLCSNSSPTCKMTQQRALILNTFYIGAATGPTAKGFRLFKQVSMLTKYFTTMKQLLAYYYRVVYRHNSHFSRTQPEQQLPSDSIEVTPIQRRAMRDVMDALAGLSYDIDDDTDKDMPLKCAVHRLILALISHVVSSQP